MAVMAKQTLVDNQLQVNRADWYELSVEGQANVTTYRGHPRIVQGEMVSFGFMKYSGRGGSTVLQLVSC
jgi:hypothetical protein